MCQEPKRHFTKEKNVRNLILMKSKYMKVKPRDTLLNCQRQSLKARPPNSLSEVYTYIALPLCSRLCSCLSKGINHPTNCGKFFKEMGKPDHLICLLRNLYAGQEARVRTGHGTTNWFKTGKGVC